MLHAYIMTYVQEVDCEGEERACTFYKVKDAERECFPEQRRIEPRSKE